MIRIKTYEELRKLQTFFERFNYCKLNAVVGADTFGFDRIFNQMFYRSEEWRQARNYVIVRDNGCDLGIAGIPIMGKVYVHHLNPITMKDIEESSPRLFDPNNLITVSHSTHNSIHFGNLKAIEEPIERKPNDTSPWRH